MDNQNQLSVSETDALIYDEARSGRLLHYFNPESQECLNFRKTPDQEEGSNTDHIAACLKFRTPQGGNNILHIAARHNHIDIIDHALSNVDSNDDQQRGLSSLLLKTNSVDETPLHTAVRYGHIDIIKLLVPHFKNLAPDPEQGHENHQPWLTKNKVDGDTVLHVAIRNGYQDIAFYLMNEADAELITCVNKAGESPLYLAAENRCCDILKAIMSYNKAKIKYSYSGPKGQNPLHAAVQAAGISECKHLINNEPDFKNGKDDNRKTPLHLAVEYKQQKVVKMLLKGNIDAARDHDTDGFTPLLRAATKGYFHIIKSIHDALPRGDIIIRDDKHGRNAIHLANNMSCFRLRKFLKLANIKGMVNEQDKDGNTPLHLSIQEGDKDKAIALLGVQATDWRIKNVEGKAPMDLLKELEAQAANTQQEPTSKQTITTGGASTTKQDTMTRLQMGMVRHAIEIREAVLHPVALKSNWGPSYKRINLQKESLAKRKPEDLKKLMDGIALIATLVVTLTFAAAFQVPGGYNEDTGSIVLIRKPSLKVFFYSDTIAMLLCIVIMLDYAWAFTTVRPRDLGNKVFMQTLTLSVALILTIMAFISGLYAVVPRADLWLMHVVSVVTFLVMVILVFLHPINLLFLRFPINISCLRLPLIFMGPLTHVGIAAYRDYRDRKSLLSKHSSKKHN